MHRAFLNQLVLVCRQSGVSLHTISPWVGRVDTVLSLNFWKPRGINHHWSRFQSSQLVQHPRRQVCSQPDNYIPTYVMANLVRNYSLPPPPKKKKNNKKTSDLYYHVQTVTGRLEHVPEQQLMLTKISRCGIRTG